MRSMRSKYRKYSKIKKETEIIQNNIEQTPKFKRKFKKQA